MEELTAEELQELKADLVSLRGELKAMLDNPSESSRPVEPDSAIGRITRLDAMQMQQMARANLRTSQRRLQQVEAALQRVQSDSYGECAECGDDIGHPRLKARPEAPFCLSCQSRREKKA
jgi:DnaK suppressor protein